MCPGHGPPPPPPGQVPDHHPPARDPRRWLASPAGAGAWAEGAGFPPPQSQCGRGALPLPWLPAGLVGVSRRLSPDSGTTYVPVRRFKFLRGHPSVVDGCGGVWRGDASSNYPPSCPCCQTGRGGGGLTTVTSQGWPTWEDWAVGTREGPHGSHRNLPRATCIFCSLHYGHGGGGGRSLTLEGLPLPGLADSQGQ